MHGLANFKFKVILRLFFSSPVSISLRAISNRLSSGGWTAIPKKSAVPHRQCLLLHNKTEIKKAIQDV
jgi:hypothetical protein